LRVKVIGANHLHCNRAIAHKGIGGGEMLIPYIY
jgi:hypothetical protein